MQDVFAESGLSAGAVYRYFKKKDDLIEAIAADALGQVTAVVNGALAETPLPGLDEIAGRMAAAVEELSGPDGPSRLAPAVWADALHDPAIAAVAADALRALRSRWVLVVQRMVDEGRLAAGTDAEAAGAAIFGLVPGFLLQYLILGDVDAATFRRGLRAVLRPASLEAVSGTT
jgi:TetR/AcrR family transcriptional regulator, transcriptional repressor of aconitase